MICRIDGIKYDISTKTNWINKLQTETKIAPKCFASFSSANNLGYADVLCYELTVISGLKHSINDYKYKDKIYISVIEHYKDSDGESYKIMKKINVGAYIKEINKELKMSHLSYGNAGQLVSVEGVVFNNSDFTITIKDLHLYKSMAYSNTNIKDDVTVQDVIVPDGVVQDTNGGERTEPFAVWASIAGTHSHVPQYEYLYKEGDPNWWTTKDYWTLDLYCLNYDKYGSAWTDRLTNEIYTDKNILISFNDDGTFNIPHYTEYLYIKSKDSDGWDYEHIIYTNALGLYYNGNMDVPYHMELQGADRTGNETYEIGDVVYRMTFVSDYTENMLFYMPEYTGEYDKYAVENFDGVDTLQLIVQAETSQQETFAQHIYFSTQPFKAVWRANNEPSTDWDANIHSIPVYVGDTEARNELFWILPKYFENQTGSTLTQFTTYTEYNKLSKVVTDVAKQFFGERMIALSNRKLAIERREGSN